MKKIIFVLLFIPNLINASELYPTLTQTNTVHIKSALNRLYIVGLQYLNEGELSKAEISFRSITAFPDYQETWRMIRYFKGKANYYLGEIHFIKKNYSEAIKFYQNVIQNFGEIEEYSLSLFKIGRSLILDKKAEDGISILKEYELNYASQDNLADNTLYWIAQGYIQQEQYSAALKILEQILKQYPQTPLAYHIRQLITQLKTDYFSPEVSNKIDSKSDRLPIKKQAQNIQNEEALLQNIHKMLAVKSKLLTVKERKLKLLEQISEIRSKELEKSLHPLINTEIEK